MAKTIRVSLLVLVLLFASIPNVNAAPKAGANCKKVGQVSISGKSRFVCAKDGKKLIWKKSKSQESAAPKETPSSNPTPTQTASPTQTAMPTPSPTKEVSQNALVVQSLFEQLLKDETKHSSKYDVSIEPARADSKWAQQSLDLVAATLDLTTRMKYPVTTNFKIIIGWEWSWIQERVPRNSWCYEGQWAGGGYCGDGINFINLKYIADAMRTGGVEVPFRTEEDKLAQSATLSHEIAHQAQGDNLAKYGRGTSFYPAWLREGGPEIIKVLAFAKTNKITYLEGRELYLKRQYDRCQFVKLNELLMADNHPDNCQGVLGLIASEALIATTKDMGSLFTFVSSKIEGYGPKFNQERKGISDETYKSVMMEIYKIDIDTWHPLVEKEFVRWAPARQR